MTRRRLLAVVSMAMVVTFATTPLAAVGVTRSELRYHEARAAEKRRIIARESRAADRIVVETRRVEAEIDALSREHRKVSSSLEDAQRRRSRLRAEISRLKERIVRNRAAVKRLRRSVARQERLMGGRAESLYKGGSLLYIELVLGAKDFSDLVTRVSLASAIMNQDRESIRRFERERAAFEKARRGLDSDLRDVAAKEKEAAKQEMAFRTLRSRQDANLRKLWGARSRKRDSLAETKSNIARVKAALDAEERESARIAAELRALAARPASRKTSVAGSRAGTGRGWIRPVPGRITSRFGYRIHPVLGTRRMHTGVDFAGSSGTPIRASRGGRVIYAGYRGGYGNTVMIDHGGGYVTLYAHQSRIRVRGGSVSQGQVIGYVGSTGMSTGPHLHFEVRINGSPVNPLNYI